MQNIYLPDRFYLTSPNDDSWYFDNIFSLIKKLTFAFLHNAISWFLADFNPMLAVLLENIWKPKGFFCFQGV